MQLRHNPLLQGTIKGQQKHMLPMAIRNAAHSQACVTTFCWYSWYLQLRLANRQANSSGSTPTNLKWQRVTSLAKACKSAAGSAFMGMHRMEKAG